jgi:septin family protein
VIAKADSMTEGELVEYRTEIRNMLANPAKFAPSRSLPPLSFNSFCWDSDVMATLGLDPERLPLALVTSKEADTVRGVREGVVAP